MEAFKIFLEKVIPEIGKLGLISVAVAAVGFCVVFCFLLWQCCRGNSTNSKDPENSNSPSQICERAEDVTLHFGNEIERASPVQPKKSTGTNPTDSTSNGLRLYPDLTEFFAASPRLSHTAGLNRDLAYIPEYKTDDIRCTDGSNSGKSKFNNLREEIIPDSPSQPKTADLKTDSANLPEKDVVTIQSIDGSNHHKSKPQKIIIAVDASGQGFGGYCVIQELRGIMYYYATHDELPAAFRVKNLQDSGELEMRNLCFALWMFGSFLKNATLFLYTDNPTIYSTTNQFVKDVDNYLAKLEEESNVFFANGTSCYIDHHREPQKFQKFIVPADMLSRGKVEGFLETMGMQYPEMKFQRLGF